jgi:predicted ribosome quality control (RQC) complex YloA/Tae2 family protein
MSVKIPFDALTLAAVVAEAQEFVDGKVQRIVQPDENTVGLSIYANGREGFLLLSCHAVFARAHFVTRRPGTLTKPPGFLEALRARIEGGRIASVTQIAGDRILEIMVLHPSGEHRVIAEIMGKHSNLILVDGTGLVISSAKHIGRAKSQRPLMAGHPYALPPTHSGDPAALYDSPFLKKLIAVRPSARQEAEKALETGAFGAYISPGNGAYPLSVSDLGVKEFERESISIALEQHYIQAIPAAEADALRSSLLSQLDRVILARDVALRDLHEADEAGGKAPIWQRYGELILAYGATLAEGASLLTAFDYDGSEIVIKLNPELDWRGNSNAYFDRAKRAKGRLGVVREQVTRLSEDREMLVALRAKIAEEPRLDKLRELQAQARERKWLHQQLLPTKKKEERPFEGHRVRETLGPGNWTILYGENAEANEYLYLRVAKPSDWWLHVRGQTSAHVVILTRGNPEKVQRETLEYAARIAVQNSPSKHGGYVPVDYTLRRYVRKPKGAPKGTAIYTHEKTLHIDGKA